MFKFGAAAPVLERAPFHIPTQKFQAGVAERTNANGNHVLVGLRVFRVGTFTDMFGFEHTWDDTHLDLMVLHFGLLRDSGIFPDVPVRADHGSSVRNVVGYYESLYRDPEDNQFLSADIEFTEPDAYEKWQRRTWRSRSIEIGMYETNDSRSYWPVVMGLAFVDIPAVEGLHGRQGSKFHFSQALQDNEENNMHKTAEEWAKDPQGWAAAAVYAQWVVAANFAQACENWEKAVNYAKALEDEAAAQNPPAPPAPPAPGVVPPAPHAAPPAAPPTSAQPQPMAFRVNGSQTSDFSTVQAHIDGLEQFAKETREAGRQAFVEKLATDNKIAASQVAGLMAHALSLNDQQFMSFRASYDAAPALSIFGQQVQQDTTPGDPGTGGPSQPTTAQEIETLKGIVQQHRYTGVSEEDLAKKSSYKRLVALGVDPSTL